MNKQEPALLEALRQIANTPQGWSITMREIAEKAIAAYEASKEEADYYQELERGYAQDRI